MKKTILAFTLILVCFFYGLTIERIEKELKLSALIPGKKNIFKDPACVRVDEHEYLYVSDSGRNHIVKLNSKGESVLKIENNFSLLGMRVPLAVDRQGRIYVLDNGNLEVKKFSPEGELLNKFKVVWTSSSFDVDSEGKIYVSVQTQNKNALLVAVYSPEGKYIKSFGSRIIRKQPHNILILNQIDISISNKDEIYVTFYNWPIIRKYSNQGELIIERKFREEIEPYCKPKYTIQDVLKEPELEWDQLINPVILSTSPSKKEDGVYLKLNGPFFFYFNENLELKKVYEGKVREISLMWEFDLNKNEDKIYGVVPGINKIICISEK